MTDHHPPSVIQSIKCLIDWGHKWEFHGDPTYASHVWYRCEYCGKMVSRDE